MSFITGVDIGGTKCAVVLGTEDGTVIKKVRFATEKTPEDTIKKIIEAIEELGVGESIGISCGGPLDEKRGIIMSPPNLPGWDNIHITEMLEKKFSVPVGLRNDANACALAEWKFGAGKGYDNVVFMTFGTGLGAGLILNGKLYSGSRGNAGELGHIRLADFGPSGYGKCGSFEGFCSGSGLRELGRGIAREYIQRGITPSFIEKCGLDGFDVADMAEAARCGDECAKKAFDTCAAMLGKGLSIVEDMLDPEIIIIGSVFARCRDLLEPGALEVMKREALYATYENAKLSAPALGEAIGDVAALAVGHDVMKG